MFSRKISLGGWKLFTRAVRTQVAICKFGKVKAEGLRKHLRREDDEIRKVFLKDWAWSWNNDSLSLFFWFWVWCTFVEKLSSWQTHYLKPLECTASVKSIAQGWFINLSMMVYLDHVFTLIMYSSFSTLSIFSLPLNCFFSRQKPWHLCSLHVDTYMLVSQ